MPPRERLHEGLGGLGGARIHALERQHEGVSSGLRAASGEGQGGRVKFQRPAHVFIPDIRRGEAERRRGVTQRHRGGGEVR